MKMNRKIFIPVIIVAVILPMIAFTGFNLYSDNSATDDVLYVSSVHGTSGNFTSSEKAEMAELILLGDVQSVRHVAEKNSPESSFKIVLSYIEIQPTNILKGIPVLNDDGYVVLKTPGGIDGIYETETDDLVLSENDHVFLYLSTTSKDLSYIPVSSDTMFVIRQGEAKDNLDNLTDLGVLVQKHKDIIKGLP